MKKTIIIIALLLVMVPSPAIAGGEWFSWDKKNTELALWSTGLLLFDYGQTQYIVEHPELYCEKYNAYLSEFPTRNEVKRYFGYAIALTHITAWILPSNDGNKETLSHHFQRGVIGLEVYMVGQNAYIGIGVNF